MKRWNFHSNSGKVVFLPQLYELLTYCWAMGTVPHNMQDANIVIVYKNKGICTYYYNYCGISLLNTARKIILWVVHRKLQILADHVFP